MVKVKLPQLRQLRLQKKPALIAGGGLLIIGAISLYVALRPVPQVAMPTHSTILPPDRTVDQLGGWQRVSPPEEEPVFAYADKLDETTISVSQQPLPESFASNIEASVKKLAEDYSATTTLEAADTTVYIGRSARGPQSVIFTKNGLLVLIKSQNTIPNQAWISYINALSDPDRPAVPEF